MRISTFKTGAVETKTLISTLKPSAFKTKTLISTPKTTISTPEPIMPTRYKFISTAARLSGISTSVFYSLRLRLTLAVSMPVVYFLSTHHSVCIV